MAVKKVIEGNLRSIVGEFEFDLPASAVWSAIADPKELTNWFPLHARVEGKVGGDVEYNWKPLFTFDWVDKITIWEPGKRLAYEPHTIDPEGKTGSAFPYLVDFQIETRNGKTILRMVHSGISTDTKWDEEFDSYFGGWSYELMSLHHYLTYHIGQKRRMIWTKATLGEGKTREGLLKLSGSGGVLSLTNSGGTYNGNLGGEKVNGKVIFNDVNSMDYFAGTIENLNNGLFRIGSGRTIIFSWLAVYGISESREKELLTALNAKFVELFGKENVESGVV